MRVELEEVQAPDDAFALLGLEEDSREVRVAEEGGEFAVEVLRLASSTICCKLVGPPHTYSSTPYSHTSPPAHTPNTSATP